MMINLECPQKIQSSLENKNKIYLGIRAEDIMPKDQMKIQNFGVFKKSINC